MTYVPFCELLLDDIGDSFNGDGLTNAEAPTQGHKTAKYSTHPLITYHQNSQNRQFEIIAYVLHFTPSSVLEALEVLEVTGS